MAQRKPNNLPWVILGGVFGLAVLGLFGFGVYTGAKSVSDEVSVTIPEMPDAKDRSEGKTRLTIHVNANNEIVLNGTTFENVDALKDYLISDDTVVLDETFVLLSLSEDATHKSLVSIKGLLDDLDVESMILINRTDTE